MRRWLKVGVWKRRKFVIFNSYLSIKLVLANLGETGESTGIKICFIFGLFSITFVRIGRTLIFRKLTPSGFWTYFLAFRFFLHHLWMAIAAFLAFLLVSFCWLIFRRRFCRLPGSLWKSEMNFSRLSPEYSKSFSSWDGGGAWIFGKKFSPGTIKSLSRRFDVWVAWDFRLPWVQNQNQTFIFI